MKNILLLLLAALLLSACSASQNNEDESDVYVFDDVTEVKEPEVKEEPEKPEEPAEEEIKYDYIVQLGAFTTEERAKEFVDKNKDKTKYPMMIIYESNLKYHLVQLPVFQEREQADKVLRELLSFEEFTDAFVKPIPELN